MVKNSSIPLDNEAVRIANRIDIIQVLRGLAVILVVFFHLKEIIRKGDFFRKVLDFLFDSGPSGVDLFFVISGFIMVYITKNSNGGLASSLEFLKKRALRIWPLYALASIVYTLIIYRYTIPKQVLYDLAKSIFFIPLSYDSPPFFGYASLSVGWSLNYEMYFYLLISVSLLFGRYRWPLFFSLIFSTLIVLPMVFGKLTFETSEAYNFGSVFLNLITNPIIWNFIYGVITGLLFIHAASFRILGKIFNLKILVVFIIILVTFQYFSGFYGGHGPFQWGLGLALLFLALLFYNQQHVVNHPAWLIYLGDISFSLYLWHFPVHKFINYVCIKLSATAYMQGPFTFILTILMTLAVSHFSYKYLETWFVDSFAGKKM